MSLKTVQLKLLTHSEQMLLAARSGRWQELDALSSAWSDILSDAINIYGDALSDIQPQLLENNRIIERCVKASQSDLNRAMRDDESRLHAVQAYLK